jgi:hypothetical protein
MTHPTSARAVNPRMDEHFLRHVEVVAAFELFAVEIDRDEITLGHKP